jgi:hypothetical protein
VALIASLSAGCIGESAPPVTAPRPQRARALAVAVSALERSKDVESPRAIVAGLRADRVCPAGGLDRRLRCHLARPSVEMSAEPTRGGWLFVIALPELSDHVHRARVWRRADGSLSVRVESEN